MKKNTNWFNKLVTYTLTLSLISPIFLSTGISAAEMINQPAENHEVKKDESNNSQEKQTFESKENFNPEESDEEIPDSTPGEVHKVDSDDDVTIDEESSESSEEVELTDSEKSQELNLDEETGENQGNSVSESENILEQKDDSDTESSNEITEEPEEYYSPEETREKAMQMMEKDQKETITTFSLRRTSATPQSFINAISDYAVSVAEEYDLYASVMIAQAGLESAWGSSILAYAPNYNLFGIKGNYNGQSFSKYSKEYSEKEGWQYIKSDFKKYPTYKESFIDYAKKLRNGPDWDRQQGSWSPTYYSGAWKENTNNYKDATQSLVGKYATDPNYNTKLNDLINTYNLTQFDNPENQSNDESSNKGENLEDDILYYDEVLSEKDINYAAKVTTVTDGIYTKPKGTTGSKVVASTTQYEGQEARVSKEATTNNGTWALISVGGKELGWIDKKALDIEKVTSTKDIKYVAKINRKTDGINTKPFGVEGYETNMMSSEIYGKEVRIIQEKTTRRSTWALITLNGKELGWIDKRGLDIEKVTSTKDIKYAAKINRKTDGINTKPFGVEGFETSMMSSEIYGKEVRIIKEAITRRGTWALITLNGKELGWIDKRGLDIEKVTSTKDIKYAAKINRKTDGINTKPFGVEGFETSMMSSEIYGKEVRIIKEATTRRATWALITLNGKELGWIDKRGLDIEKVTSTKNVNYTAVVNRSTDGINTKPFGVEGYETKYMSSSYLGKNVKVTKEATTRRATWALISLNGKELGWIDKAGLKTSPIIVIDAGHGGNEPGAVSGGVQEKTLNLSVAKKVEQRLKNSGYEVIMTRTNDTFMSLSDRAALANRRNADIFVSIHANAFIGSAYGIETYSYNKNGNAKNPVVANDPDRILKSSLLSTSIQNSLISNTGAYDRGAKEANFHVIRETAMPAVLVEMGFIDNTSERNKMKTDSYQNKIADGIVQGINRYFNTVQ